MFNLAGKHAVTVAGILKENSFYIILEQFVKMIQSGKNLFIDDNTSLCVYTFSPPSGGAEYFFCANKEDLFKKCRSIVVIRNPVTIICFSKAFVLGLAYAVDNKVVYDTVE